MQRKARKRQEATKEKIDKTAKAWAKLISLLPRIQHQGETFIDEENRIGCLPFGSPGILYCSECYANGWCHNQETIRYYLIDGEMIRRDYERGN